MALSANDNNNDAIYINPIAQAPNNLNDAAHPSSARGDTRVEGFHQPQGEAIQDIPLIPYTTGWVVALSGPLKGYSFALTFGSNHIGRSRKNQICIAGDAGISSHALVITYDDMQRAFFAQTGDRALQIAYIDKMPLLSSMKLKPHTTIQLSPDVGDIEGTKLLFIPLCSEQFCWNQSPDNIL